MIPFLCKSEQLKKNHSSILNCLISDVQHVGALQVFSFDLLKTKMDFCLCISKLMDIL